MLVPFIGGPESGVVVDYKGEVPKKMMFPNAIGQNPGDEIPKGYVAVYTLTEGEYSLHSRYDKEHGLYFRYDGNISEEEWKKQE